MATLGLHLAEAKDLLQQVQEVVVDEQVRTCLAEQMACPGCGRARAHKDAKTIVVRTLFGTVRLPSPRWYHCPCQPQPTRTFSPLVYGHVNPYGTFRLDLDDRLPIESEAA